MSLPRPVPNRQLNVKGLLIAVGLPVVLVGALVATLLGTGAFSRDSQGEDASLWLWTTPVGEIARVNGLTAATDARFEVTDAAGNAVQIEQTDTHLLLRDIVSGRVSAIDLSTLQVTGEAETAPGEGVRVALHEDGAFIVDQTRGLVSQVDPSTLASVGEPLSFAAGLTGGAFDREGRLWVGVPREGTIVQIEPRQAGARARATEVVAEPRQDLALTVLGDGVAVLNATVQQMTTLRSDGRRSQTDIELLGPTATAETSPGTIAAVTVTDPPSVVTVNDEQAKTFDIDTAGSNLLGASMEFHQRIYVPDGAAGRVWVFDLDGERLDGIEIDSGGGPIELYHTGDTLFANAVNTNHAVVVSSDGNARQAEKDRDDILGGNAPPDDQDDENGDEGDDGDDGDNAPEVGPPGAVANLDGTVGDGRITLSWDAAPNNGSALTKYTIEGAGQTWEIAPSQRVLDIDDLDNGESYTFDVTAHNAVGAGDTATSPSIVPSAEVPDPVDAVEAEANGDGTVTVSWDEADGQGNTITGYQIEAISGEGERTVVGQSTGTEFHTADGDLAYGMQYTFSVTTLAGDAAAEPSEPSEVVTPYNVPDAPSKLLAETASDSAGAFDVTWDRPADNGRPIDRYIVRAGDQTEEVSGATNVRMDGFGDGEQVTVTVTAVNEAGESDPAQTTSNTMVAPQAAITGSSSTYSSITVNFSWDDGGGDATCDLYRWTYESPEVSEPCDGSMTVKGLWASTEATFRVEITNAVDTVATGRHKRATKTVSGKVYFGCSQINNTYCNTPNAQGGGANGVGVFDNRHRNGDPLRYTQTGDTYTAKCWSTGPNIKPRGTENGEHVDYHPGKNATDKQIMYARDKWIPFVWFNIDGVGKNSIGNLPRC